MTAYQVLRRVKIYGDAKNRIGSKLTRRKKSVSPHTHSVRNLETYFLKRKKKRISQLKDTGSDWVWESHTEDQQVKCKFICCMLIHSSPSPPPQLSFQNAGGQTPCKYKIRHIFFGESNPSKRMPLKVYCTHQMYVNLTRYTLCIHMHKVIHISHTYYPHSTHTPQGHTLPYKPHTNVCPTPSAHTYHTHPTRHKQYTYPSHMHAVALMLYTHGQYA